MLPTGFNGDWVKFLATNMFLVLVGSMLLGASAQFKIPLHPVPVTGQTLVVLLIGMVYGPWLAGATVFAYLAEGVMGLPVFAGGAAGWLTIIGPTGGYLVGFLVAAVIMGFLASRGMGRGMVSTAIAMMISTITIYACGVAWLNNFVPGGLDAAIAVGVTPFLYGDMLKLVIATGLMPAAWKAVRALKGD